MVVIYPGVSDSFYPVSQKEVIRVKNKYKIEKAYLLSVGTREPRKNVAKIIEAFKFLKGQFDIELIIAGKLGWGVERNPNSERIKLVGFIPEADLPALYTGASCFVYPSLYEGFGFPVLEALACGTDVVTSKGGSLAEVGGEFATYVEPEDSDSIAEGINKVLKKNNTDKTAQLKWARSFSWDKTAREVLNIYNNIY